MILGEKKLRKLFPGLDEKQYQPASLDLKLEEVYRVEDYSDTENSIKVSLIDNNKNLPDYIELLPVGSDDIFILRPQQVYLVDVGPMHVPEGYAQSYKPRSTIFRMGLSLETGWTDPNFNGRLKFKLINDNDFVVAIKRGERIAQAITYYVEDGGRYSGDYQEE